SAGESSRAFTSLYPSTGAALGVLVVKGGLIHMVVNLDFDTILVWILVGLVAGFAASHLALGHGLGIVGDVLIGIVGAFLGGFLAGVFHWGITIGGHPIIREMVIAFIGAAILLLVVRLLGGMGRGRSTRRAYWG